MFARSQISLISVVCAIALLAGACGGSSDGTSTDVAAPDDNPDATSEPTSAEPDRVTESPLADLIGIPFNDDDAAEQYFNDLGRQAEIKIAECMLAQGFEYQVVDYSQIDSLDSNIDFESREFAEEYGFGIASNPFEESFEAFEAFTNPNQEYTDSLTEGELEAYQTALTGETSVFDSEEPQSFQPGGCQGNAFEEVFAFGVVFEQFGDEFEEIEEAYNADPRIVGASDGWSSCMSEAGHNFSDRDSAEDEVRRRYESILRSTDAFPDGDTIAPPDAPVQTEGDGEEFIFGPQTLSPEAQAQVDDLAVEERAIALASWDCNAPLREIEDEVRLEYEQRFVDQHGAAIREALGE